MENYILNRSLLRKSQKSGFTLLEILIVIAIIGILVSIGVASYSTAQTKGRDSRRRSDMKAAQAAVEQYYSESASASYPSAGCDLGANATSYLPAGFPVDPKNVAPYEYVFTCADTSYCFCSKLEQTTSNNSDSSCNYQAATKDHYCVSSLQ